MRTRFGLILKIMVRTKSYILPELRYLTNHSINALNYNSFHGLSLFPPCFPSPTTFNKRNQESETADR